MRRTQRASAAVAGVIAAGLILSGCAGGASSENTENADGTQTVKMGTQPWIGYGQWYVADEQGILADHGVDLEMTSFNTDADVTAAFASGSVDVANVATHTAMILIQSGVPIKMVLVEDVSTTADAVLARGGIQGVEELEGKKVAYEQGTTSDLLLNYALDSAGMTLDDIEPVPMPASSAGSALIAGKVDAAVTYEPYITAAVQDSDDVEVLFTAGEEPGLISDVLVVSDTFADENPEALRALVASWGDAVDYYDANSEEGRKIIAENVGEEPDALSTAFDGVRYYGAEENAKDLAGDFTKVTLPLVLTAAQKAGIITGDLDLSNVVNSQFVTN